MVDTVLVSSLIHPCKVQEIIILAHSYIKSPLYKKFFLPLRFAITINLIYICLDEYNLY